MLNCELTELQDLMGRVEFSRAEISCMEAELSRTGVEMPQFRQLGGMLADQSGGNRLNIARAIQVTANILYYNVINVNLISRIS